MYFVIEPRGSAIGFTVCIGRWSVPLVACSLILASSTALAEEPSPGTQQTPMVVPTPSAPVEPAAVVKSSPVGPTGMIRLADDTWLRFGFQLQFWFKAAQDRVKQPDGSDGGYAMDFYCRRCRFIATGSVVRNVSFMLLFESGDLGKADPNSLTGAKAFGRLNPPVLLDAWGSLRLHNAFTISAGNILLPLTRNGMQPTTTYLSIDNANVDTTPALQGNTVALRDLGAQISGFLFGDHLEYRVGLFQGTRAPAMMTADIPPITTQNASHNMFRTVAMLQLNLWDPEKGYFNGGHYFGRKKVLGVSGSFDYQKLGTDDFPAGISKDPYFGISSAAFINYPLTGAADPLNGGDELVALAQFGYYDGGGKIPVDITMPGTYPAVIRQINLLGEAAYYNKNLKLSLFGKFEMRRIYAAYPDEALPKANNNAMWIAGGLKYYVAEQMMNFGLQYERVLFPDAFYPGAPSTTQSATHNVTVQMQLFLY